MRALIIFACLFAVGLADEETFRTKNGKAFVKEDCQKPAVTIVEECKEPGEKPEDAATNQPKIYWWNNETGVCEVIDDDFCLDHANGFEDVKECEAVAKPICVEVA